MNEAKAVSAYVERLMGDSDQASDVLFINGRMYQISVKQLSDPKEVEAATQQYLRSGL